MMLDLRAIDTSWTLFLDRDGVINVDKPDSYIFNPSEFKFMDGVLSSLPYLARRFQHIVIVTNQRGVGRGLMTEDDLQAIHADMMKAIEAARGRIDRIYYCIANDNDDPNRKPNPGMAFRAKKDFPAIDLTKSVVVGNNFSDMQFGRRAGMHTVFIRSTIENPEWPHKDIDLSFRSLEEFAKALQTA